MMKHEFEELIGKEVSFDTFKMYENMYNACPDWVTKQEFVKLLNIEAIPESEEAIARREANERYIKELEDQLDKYKVTLKYDCEKVSQYRRYAREETTRAEKKYWNDAANSWVEEVKKDLVEISKLEFLLQIA